MTLKELALHLLKYTGVSSLDPAANTMPLLKRGLGTDLGDVVVHINGAFQELFDDAPSFITERPMSGILRPPTPLTFAATAYSSAISGASGYQDWMEGCTIRIGGDPIDNRITGATSLLRPFMGGTGTVSGMVYADAIPLPSYVRNVLEPVQIPTNPHLQMSGSWEEFQLCLTGTVSRQDTPSPFSYNTLASKTIGEPRYCYGDSAFDEASEFLPIYLRFSPMPGVAYPVTFRAKIKPPLVTATMIDSGDHTTDPLGIIPLDWVQSILLPIAVQRFSAHPRFSVEPKQMEEINRQYVKAKAILKGFKPLVSRTKGVWAQG